MFFQNIQNSFLIKLFLNNFLAISANLEQVSFFLPIFLHPKLGGGVNKSETHFRPIFSPFQLIWDNFDFFHFDQLFFPGGGQKIRNPFPTNFLAISTNLGQPFFFFLYQIHFTTIPGLGGRVGGEIIRK